MKYIKFMAVVIASLLLASCHNSETGREYPIGNIGETTSSQEGDKGADIILKGNTAEISRNGASLDNNILTITKGGSYTLSGEFNGGIVVDTPKTEKVELILNSVSVDNPDGSAIYVASTDKVTLVLAEGTDNVFSDGETYALEDSAEPNACIYSADDMTIKGSGSLFVYAKCKNGIQTKNDLRIKDGQITVTAPNNALKGKDSVEISGGVINVTGADDGIKSDNEKEEGRGIVTITGGDIKIMCQDDGIQAYNKVEISGDARVYIDANDNIINCDGTVNVEDGCIVE
jgi:hypothetical protein